MSMKTTQSIKLTNGSNAVRFEMAYGSVDMVNNKGECMLMSVDAARDRIRSLLAAGWKVA